MSALWKAADATSRDINRLMESAAKALHGENTLLAGALDRAATNSPAGTRAYGNVGRGLSYWVYETTLVYLIWRAWVADGFGVAWDWTVSDLEGRGRTQRADGGQRFDLVVFDDSSTIDLAFEAKWWNSVGDQDRRAIRADAAKLRDSRLLSTSGKYLLVFWHEARASRYQEDVAAFCREANLSFAGEARFDARFRQEGADVKGSFVLAALQVCD